MKWAVVRRKLARVDRALDKASEGAQIPGAVILAQMPKRLRPTYGSVTALPSPPELHEDEVSDLMMFLGSLSARHQGR